MNDNEMWEDWDKNPLTELDDRTLERAINVFRKGVAATHKSLINAIRMPMEQEIDRARRLDRIEMLTQVYRSEVDDLRTAQLEAIRRASLTKSE